MPGCGRRREPLERCTLTRKGEGGGPNPSVGVASFKGRRFGKARPTSGRREGLVRKAGPRAGRRPSPLPLNALGGSEAGCIATDTNGQDGVPVEEDKASRQQQGGRSRRGTGLWAHFPHNARHLLPERACKYMDKTLGRTKAGHTS